MMFRRIDRSPLLARWIERLSTFLARRRGLPVVIGILLVVVSFVLQLLDIYAASQALRFLGVVLQNVGILMALIGLLLAEPLGK
jgi:hypothetical protein